MGSARLVFVLFLFLFCRFFGLPILHFGRWLVRGVMTHSFGLPAKPRNHLHMCTVVLWTKNCGRISVERTAAIKKRWETARYIYAMRVPIRYLLGTSDWLNSFMSPSSQLLFASVTDSRLQIWKLSRSVDPTYLYLKFQWENKTKEDYKSPTTGRGLTRSTSVNCKCVCTIV